MRNSVIPRNEILSMRSLFQLMTPHQLYRLLCLVDMWMTKWDGWRRNRSWPTLKYYPSICLEATTTIRDSETRSPEHEEVLSSRPWRVILGPQCLHTILTEMLMGMSYDITCCQGEAGAGCTDLWMTSSRDSCYSLSLDQSDIRNQDS